ncbi:PIN domain-containing protein [Streptomyces sp. NPDC127051]|uniref:PIN domain-containing protein n=1 Tax=Streptomyces sp. NPDC127051 TaxID=3347119 RepID=UPI00365DDFAB
MRLKPGVTLQIAQDVLVQALREWENAYSNQTWDRYNRAVSSVEKQLSRCFAEPDLGARLYEGHYWQLATMATSMGFLQSVLVREIQQQIETLELAQQELVHLQAYTKRPGTPVIYDTNMLVHWRPPNEVKWTDVLRDEGVRTREVRLVVPLVVIDELDRQKSGAGQLGERASRAIRYLEGALPGGEPGMPTEIRKGVTLEVRLDPLDHRRGDADMEILLCAAELDQLKPDGGTRVLSDDFGMHLRSQGLSLPAMRLPASYRKGASTANA